MVKTCPLIVYSEAHKPPEKGQSGEAGCARTQDKGREVGEGQTRRGEPDPEEKQPIIIITGDMGTRPGAAGRLAHQHWVGRAPQGSVIPGESLGQPGLVSCSL